MVTPYSQFVGVQAAMNVNLGARKKCSGGFASSAAH
jgi:pyruvate/oxaloacetate carboxyltransferase